MRKEKSTTRKVVGIVLDVVLVLMLLYIGSTIYLRSSTGNPHASLFGITTHFVISDSMEPNIHKNDVIIVKEADNYEVGDVVTYISSEGRSITHRIISVTFGGYIIQGDDNPEPDPGTISPDQIVGKMILRIPLGG
jgi:signal peptidase